MRMTHDLFFMICLILLKHQKTLPNILIAIMEDVDTSMTHPTLMRHALTEQQHDSAKDSDETEGGYSTV